MNSGLAPVTVKGGNETILIAEDNDEVRDLIKTVLTEYGYSIIEAIDGEDAIDRSQEAEGIGLIILDTVMPKKNGREVYDEIIRIKPGIKVLFTSGYTRDVFLDKGIEDKKVNFLQKPILPDALLRKVREVLDERVGHLVDEYDWKISFDLKKRCSHIPYHRIRLFKKLNAFLLTPSTEPAF